MSAPRVSVLAALLTVAATAAVRAESLWYLRGYVGASTLRDTELVDFCCDADVSFDRGSVYGIAVGHEFTPHFALELEVAQRRGDVDEFAYNSEFIGGGETRAETLMLNAVFTTDLPGAARWHPYIGAGLGVARLKIEGDFGDPYPFERDGVLAWQGFAGVAVDVAPRWRLFGELRGFDTEDGTWGGPWGPATADWQSWEGMVGASWRF